MSVMNEDGIEEEKIIEKDEHWSIVLKRLQDQLNIVMVGQNGRKNIMILHN